jgi:glycolate oxidase iron-sulfur subunit
MDAGPIQIGIWDDDKPPEPALIEDCVHCGFCLPTCPTYQLWGEEADSPRGRIVLMRAGHEEPTELSAPMVEHFDNCLGCMACVTACPSGVQYDKLIEDTRAQVERKWERTGADKWTRRVVFALFPHPDRLRWLTPVMRFGHATHLDRLTARLPLGRLSEVAKLAPAPPRRHALPERVAAQGESRGTVAVLRGCVQRVMFSGVNADTAAVLAAEGWDVEAPQDPSCCGALQLHAGMGSDATANVKATIEALAGYDRIVANAAGCGSAMKDYGHVMRQDPEWADRAQAFAEKVVDVSEILAEGDARAERHPVEMKVAYHDACHLAHAQAVRSQPRELLRAVPGLELVEPAEWEICCGSAGIYNVVKPEAAAELGRRKAQNLLDTGAEAVVAANPGCILQIAAHTRELGRELPVMHPVELLARSLRGGG